MNQKYEYLEWIKNENKSKNELKCNKCGKRIYWLKVVYVAEVGKGLDLTRKYKICQKCYESSGENKLLESENLQEAMRFRMLDDVELARLLHVDLYEVLKAINNKRSYLETILFEVADILEVPPYFLTRHHEYMNSIKNNTIALLHWDFKKENEPKCSVCKTNYADLLCDNYISEGKTCDKPICENCSTKIDGYLDFCPDCLQIKF